MVVKLRARRKLAVPKAQQERKATLRVKKIDKKPEKITQAKKRKLDEYEESVEENESKQVTEKNKLCIIGLDKNVKEDEMKKLFPRVKLVDIASGKSDGVLNMGAAFLTFESENDAKKVLDNIQGKEVNGHKVLVNYATPQTETYSRKLRSSGGVKSSKDGPPPNKRQKNIRDEKKKITQIKSDVKRKLRTRRNNLKHKK